MKKLNFGCGRDIRDGYINVDIDQSKKVDIAFDFDMLPYPFSDNEFDEILADNVFEHLTDIPAVMKELHRISKPGAIIKIIVPYYNSYGAYNDLTHKHYFSHLSFEPFYKKKSRGTYLIKEEFELKEIKYIPTRLGKLFLLDILRLPLSFMFGQIIQALEIHLAVKK
ncbi:MAG TPA: methyltransferase domain-containing protein [Candidatus Kapabacteria bacterium]|nr:methyltransferase domain-containing protein [Candidatus Kapabacteria bacterium]